MFFAGTMESMDDDGQFPEMSKSYCRIDFDGE
jgi:hypothetical protein